MLLPAGAVVGGDFRVVELLGKGGMGEVYLAEQLSTGKRRALKIMKPELVGDSGLLARFEQEARIGARIASEHVVEVVAAGLDPSTRAPYLAMELLDGEPLDALLARRGGLAPHEARPLLAQLGHGLAAAHRAGVVHRDLKPENIFIARSLQQGATTKVKILDFGIAKLTAEVVSRTQQTMSLGTPRWMAPEQTGGAQPISPATDVWALGLIAFRILSGRYYWKHATGGGPTDSVMTLMREVLFEPIVPASRRAHEFGVGHLLPPGFDEWFARCVAREPRERFPDAEVAGRALDAVLAHASAGMTGAAFELGPVPGRPRLELAPTLGSGDLGPSPVRRGGRTGLVVALVLLGVLLPALAIGGWFWFGREDPRERKRSSARAAREEESESEAEEEEEPEAPPAPPAPPTPTQTALAGKWRTKVGLNPNGTRYLANVDVSPLGGGYRFRWSTGQDGVGLVSGSVLGVGFGQGEVGVAIYEVQGGVLRGRHTSLGFGGVEATQVLQGPGGLSGRYQIVQSSAGVSGQVTIAPNGELYSWVADLTGGMRLRGVGILERDLLVVGFVPEGSPALGVVSYSIAGSELDGRWGGWGDVLLGRERLMR